VVDQILLPFSGTGLLVALRKDVAPEELLLFWPNPIAGVPHFLLSKNRLSNLSYI